uniref:RRM domain-containing protein n=1 Tax=Octactis speculum TaxID=3111310 RepID=A0A7S2GRU9_9STRA|mmetsp:Transcript_54292/g.74175  ORF Transcript_54292/g.74175 Transcript_54292/m.74175 type:complete len:540 (+) Transcript_54292:85-1704(+)|eukprot:CAMPEP_0185748370 /NCGR_PEP_ID=MMETSP1174-20130828/7057_1 /TAXON_ID=35687 /ORGANISM="Dictyocha speculum, Strain CCMP1381" /LENGTH=539 /DNA_ID=CAMNT_0028424005 /DNA_START=74 /DNA_END=1693 /DNA_ORIENTATION=-
MSYGGDGGYRPGVGDRPGGWDPQSLGRKADTPNGMAVGTDFPFVCEVCLGPNPYVRMVKMPFGDKLCKISARPFQAFRWRAGPGGRWKETIVAPEVAQEKNICQACIVDMTYGVPVGVRDMLLEADTATGALAPVSSDPNTSFYWQQKDALTKSGQNASHSLQNLEPSRQLLTLARSIQAQESRSATAWRNLPRICSFWLAGTCTRVVQGKCPFRPCNGMFEFPEIASSHKEQKDCLCGRLKTEGAVVVMRTLDTDVREAIHNALKGNKDDAIRKRFDGNDDLSKRYLRRARESAPELTKPKDESITSLWVGGLEPPMSEADLRDKFYSFGEIRAVRILMDKCCAFVEFTTREAAETAASKLHRNLTVRGLKLDIDWAKPASLSSQNGSKPSGGGGGTGAGAPSPGQFRLPPPPGTSASMAPMTLPGPMLQRLEQASGVRPSATPPSGGDTASDAPPSKRLKPEGADGGDGKGSKSSATPPAGPPPLPVYPPPPPLPFPQAPMGGMGGGMPYPPPPPAWRPSYPSMNPNRMGAKPDAQR